ncbi:metallophosphoesterase family protein [Corynebacterium breve]|uniref:Metallophosphoesterase family protein n=1 Tax=Corynebacterium breve TaxID=3049799 RepID=A0ABY8VFW9_9CORY|nr:metallophosphoesterase family protein [Corynebacterium breve]WIM67660.1 metallophosphoesterase family protein [Corynebacterium breve]
MSNWSKKTKMIAALTASALMFTGLQAPSHADTSVQAQSSMSSSSDLFGSSTWGSSWDATPETTSPEVPAEEIDPVYGEKNGMDLIELQDTKPEVAPVPVNNQPNRIAMNLPEDPTTAMSFNWFTTDAIADSVVLVSTNENMSGAVEFTAETTEIVSEYAERDADGYYIYADVTKDEKGNFIVDENGEPEEVLGYFTDEQITRENSQWTAQGSGLAYLGLQEVVEHSHKVTADGLEADTQYYFQLGSPTEGLSEVGSFRTASEEADGVQFIHYTDTQNAYWNANVNNEAAYGADTLEKALEVAPEADFAVHTGDFVEIAQVEDEWVDNLDMSRESNMNLPHAYTPGNHDEYGLRYTNELDLTAFNDHTNVPVTNDKINGGSYYSFDHSGAHFVVLNTNDNKKSEDNPDGGAIGTEQMEWAKQDIAEARENGADWIVLAYHKPVYSASYHALQDSDVQVTREEFVKIADELGVDVVLQGHDHNLTRTKSLVYTPHNFSYGEVEETEKTIIDGVEYHVNPEGVTYVIPNTSGTKTYDAIYQKGADHVAKVRPRLNWMTPENINHWNSLFDIAEQPEKSPKFEHKHDNYRQSEQQTFAVYTVDEDTFKIEFYMVEGDLHGGEERTVTLRDAYGIAKQ